MDYHVKTVGFKSLDNGYILEYYQNLNGVELRSAKVADTITRIYDQVNSLDLEFAQKVSMTAVLPEVKQLEIEPQGNTQEAGDYGR